MGRGRRDTIESDPSELAITMITHKETLMNFVEEEAPRAVKLSHSPIPISISFVLRARQRGNHSYRLLERDISDERRKRSDSSTVRSYLSN